MGLGVQVSKQVVTYLPLPLLEIAEKLFVHKNPLNYFHVYVINDHAENGI